MSGEAVMPLRISKSSPAKHASPSQRALAEISPMERRRNSPIWNQTTKRMVSNQDSSPFDSGMSSPRNFWQGKVTSPSPFNENSYDRPESPSLVRHRASIENLKKVSRVKNSSMYAREQQGEYDPSSPVSTERPLAAGRPLSTNNSFMGLDSITSLGSLDISFRKENPAPARGHRRGESQTTIPMMQPLSPESDKSSPVTSRHTSSPTKSSFINKGANTLPRNYDRGSIQLSDDEDGPKMSPPRQLRRQAKSVTFDVAPPQVNEYESQTPDPSSVASGSRESSYDNYDDEEEDLYDIDRAMETGEDDSFDASLEDTDKTPVVMPEDWNAMGLDAADASMIGNVEDPFGGQNNKAEEGRTTPSQEWNKYRTVSIDSEGDLRPLPPVPKIGEDSGSRRNSGNVLDRVHNAQRSLPAPPPAATISKSDLLSMKDKTMTLEDRLRLMGIRDNSLDKQGLSPNSGDREKARLQRHGLGIHVHEDEPEKLQAPGDFTFPRISRESILKKVRGRNLDYDEVQLEDCASSPPPYDIDSLDPDVPLPSRETSNDQTIKEEESSFADLYSVPALSNVEDDTEREGSVIRNTGSLGGSESFYSLHNSIFKSSQGPPKDGNSTPKAHHGVRSSTPQFDQDGNNTLGLPDLSSFLGGDPGFQTSFHSYLSSGSDELAKQKSPPKRKEPSLTSSAQAYLPRETTPEQQVEEEEPQTPESVIHQPLSSSSDSFDGESSEVPEQIATIKAPGTALKTRPSVTPADFATMAATRRQVSGSMAVPPPVPEKSPKRLSFTNIEPPAVETTDKDVDKAVAAHKKRRESFKPKLDLPDDSITEEMGLGLDKEFDRVIESSKVDLLSFHPGVFDPLFATPDARKVGILGGKDIDRMQHFEPETDDNDANVTLRIKKGYLMRQNTKIIVAKRNFSNENTSVDGERPASADATMVRTPSGNIRPTGMHERTKSWTTEPWNGKIRRKSLRQVDRKAPSGPPPPLPGQDSVVTGGLDTVLEDQSFHADEFEDGVERGRLFVKVVGVKDLDLPLPQNERVWFQLTLDNGLHCVTTSRLELGRSAPIGQEFELVVLNDLEFQLTLQTQLTPPAGRLASPDASPQKAQKSPNKSTFSRLFASPKKRREQERLMQQKEEEERQARQRKAAAQEAATRRVDGPTAWNLLHELCAEEDGSFGRSYVALKNHEDSCFGRPITVDMPLFNEWAIEKDPNISNSVKSKRGTQQAVIRRPPYQVGKLTLQLLYVPKPKGVTIREEDMPKSMNACVRQMAAAERAVHCEWEGFLSQQGGDCPYWRRRFFRLSGFDLTAYHETTMQKRVRISLLKATRLIDDKTTLLKPDGTAVKKSGGRRKSAFAEEDQAYMFVEEGFRIRFANGEAIDFYADSTDDKAAWMKALSLVIGKNAAGGQVGGLRGSNEESWCDVVLKRERLLKERAEKAASAVSATNGVNSTTTGPYNAAMNTESAVTTQGGATTNARPRSQPGVPVSSQSMLSGFDHMQSGPNKKMPVSPKKANGDNARPKSQIGQPTQARPAQLRDGPAPGRLSSRRQNIKSMIF